VAWPSDVTPNAVVVAAAEQREAAFGDEVVVKPAHAVILVHREA
jgi:hypothetical protein